MSDKDRPGYTPVTYVRPNLSYCCGRSGEWGCACWQGPDASGQCGGASECKPARTGDRWECRRPALAGGACKDGPLPDGSCCNTRPPCTPKRSMRSLRGAVSRMVALAVLLLLVIGVDPTTKSVVNPAAIDAGNLSSVHAGFTREDGCASCHVSAPHQAGGWLLAAFSNNDTSGKCVDCHSFAGPAMRAHNAELTKNPKYAGAPMQDKISCATCHTEHKGTKAKLSEVADVACASCHQPAFDNFEKGHPAFSPKFATAPPGNVFFDHASHIDDYFVNPKHTKGAGRDAKFAAEAKSDCTACHAVDTKTREIKIKSYDQVCAGCHQNQVTERELVLLEPERMTSAASVLLGLSRDEDEEANTQALQKLWRSMAGEGRGALDRLAPATLLAGLETGLVRSTGAVWAKAGDLPQPDDDVVKGWAAGENSEGNPALFYRPVKHVDPVLKAWFEKLRGDMAGKDADKQALAREAMTEFLDKQTGPGACGKCHAAGLRTVPAVTPATTVNAVHAVNAGTPGSEWRYAAPVPDKHGALTKYSHPKHIAVGNPGASCSSCHEVNASSTYAKYFTPKVVPPESYQSNFSGIKKETCVTCHRTGQVESSCQTCHAYHPEHALNVGFKHKNKELDKK